MFFSNPDNQEVLLDFARKTRALSFKDSDKNIRLELLKKIVQFILHSPAEWDEKCAFNIKNIGEQFLSRLRNMAYEEGAALEEGRDLDHAYVCAYRFVCEYDLFVGAGKELSIELRSVKASIEQNLISLEDNFRSQITYASYLMPASIVKDFLQQPDLNFFKDFSIKKEEAARLKKEWDEEIRSKKDEVSRLKEILESYKNAFNFVGLYKGFSDLGEKKEKESALLLTSLMFMAAFILVPLFVEIYFINFDLTNSNSINSDRLFLLVPIFSVEIILVYFFRIILQNHRSVKAQIIQIELRKTLCQFIQSYANYSAEIKKQDPTALEKFESLIFSGVVSDPEKVPSTFDGLDQISTLLKNIRGP